MSRLRSSRTRKAELSSRITSTTQNHFETCTIPDCGRQTTRAARTGLSANLCAYHLERQRRIGNAWAAPIRAAALRPYLKVALAWIAEERDDFRVAHVLRCLRGLLDGAGPVDPAMNLNRRSAEYRARVAFARLREAEVAPERILASHLAVAAIIADDRDCPSSREFRIVQTAKSLHRLASGTHRRWVMPLPSGDAPVELHVYPKSTGRVLRVMGEAVEELCCFVTDLGRDAVRERRKAKYGPHPSYLPGWVPAWKRRREAVGVR